MSAVARLDAWLQKNRPDYYASLQPGLTPDELSELERRCGQPFSDSFKSFLTWRSGGDEPLLENWSLNTELVETWQELCDTEFDRPNSWNEAWIPFLQNGAGDHLCLDMAGTFTRHKGQILEFWLDWEARAVTHPSFDLWLDVLVRSLEAGGWEEGEDGDWESNDRYTALYEELCPGYPKGHEAG